MTAEHRVTVPLLGVNEDSGTISDWLVKTGDSVREKQPICSFETTKAVVEVLADRAGIITVVREVGQVARQQETIAIIAETTVDPARFLTVPAAAAGAAITGPASALATRRGLSATVLQRVFRGRPVIRESDVEDYARTLFKARTKATPRKVAIYGCGQGGHTVHEALAASGVHRVVAFLDDAPEAVSPVPGLPVMRLDQAERPYDAVACIINDVRFRSELPAKLRALGLEPLAVIDPRAMISDTVAIGDLTLIKMGAVIELNTSVGAACIVDNGCVLAHDNVLEDGVRLAPGVVLGSNIRIGTGTILGMNSCVSTGVTVGRYCIVSPGAAVMQDVPDLCIVEGVPGRVIGQRKAP